MREGETNLYNADGHFMSVNHLWTIKRSDVCTAYIDSNLFMFLLLHAMIEWELAASLKSHKYLSKRCHGDIV